MTEKTDAQIEWRDIAEIKPYPKNAKDHPDEQVRKIAASIREFGFNQPIVVDAEGIIVVGHGRYLAAHLIGLDRVPIFSIDISDERARAYRLADNVRVLMLNALYYGSAQNRERVVFLGSKEPFEAAKPRIVDDTKRFRDVFDGDGPYREIKDTDRNRMKIDQLLQFSFELVGKWDRVGTLTTQMGCGEKAVPLRDWFRMLTPLECERLQGFPDGWTLGESDSARYFAMGNAVNCRMSEYLFAEYLPSLWKTGWRAAGKGGTI